LCELTLDHTVFLKDSRFPGGQAKGKDEMSASEETGERQVTATLGVSVGTGEMDSAEGPSDDSLVQSGLFVEADYVEKAYAADPVLQWLEVCCIGPMTPKFPKIKGPGTLNGTIIPWLPTWPSTTAPLSKRTVYEKSCFRKGRLHQAPSETKKHSWV